MSSRATYQTYQTNDAVSTVAERVILAGAGEDQHFGELRRLVSTLGPEVAGEISQSKRDRAGYLGSGKRDELRRLVSDSGATLVVTDDELTTSQARVLEGACEASVVDRTELIIRIFESHAGDKASRLQVELADLEYRLPRVKGRNQALSRLGGGVGTRGPGEQQLEYDRRAIRRRMDTINEKLRKESGARRVRGERLRDGQTPSVALVGYTNAGKTTILNALSGEERSTRDRLFETLETTTRMVSGSKTPTNGSQSKPLDFVVTDTVGFIRKLPTQLVHSFSGTIETAADADVVVLCADASSGELDEEIATVRETLYSAGNAAEDIYEKVILCLNKVDLLTREELREVLLRHPEAVTASAAGGEVQKLYESARGAISSDRRRIQVMIPHSDYGEVSRIFGIAEVHAHEPGESGVWMDVSLPERSADSYESYRLSSGVPSG